MNDDCHSDPEQSAQNPATTHYDETRSSNEERKGNQPSSGSPKRICGITWDRFIEAIMAIVIASFTGMLWWTSSDQLTAMNTQTNKIQGQLNLMKEQLQISERAYISIGRLEPDLKRHIIYLTLRNTGKAPTEKIRIDRGVVMRGYVKSNLLIQYDPISIPLGVTKIFPGEAFFQHEIGMTNWGIGEQKAIEKGGEFIRVIGFIIYHDGFQDNQVTPFDYRFSAGKWIAFPVNPPPVIPTSK